MRARISRCVSPVSAYRRSRSSTSISVGGGFDVRFGELRCGKKFSRGCRTLRLIENWRRFRLEQCQSVIGIKLRAGKNADVRLVERAFGFDDAVPDKWRRRVGVCGDAMRLSAVVAATPQCRERIAVKIGAHADVESKDDEADDRADAAACPARFRSDLIGHEASEFGQQERGEPDRDDPRVDVRQPVQCDTSMIYEARKSLRRRIERHPTSRWRNPAKTAAAEKSRLRHISCADW